MRKYRSLIIIVAGGLLGFVLTLGLVVVVTYLQDKAIVRTFNERFDGREP